MPHLREVEARMLAEQYPVEWAAAIANPGLGEHLARFPVSFAA